jgi:DNA anti-recombination protein RmuC
MYRMTWTDERMDDFAKHTDQRFDAVDRRFDAVDRRFDTMDQRFDSVDKRLDRFEDRFDSLQRTLMLTGGGIIATLIAGIVSVLVTQL